MGIVERLRVLISRRRCCASCRHFHQIVGRSYGMCCEGSPAKLRALGRWPRRWRWQSCRWWDETCGHLPGDDGDSELTRVWGTDSLTKVFGGGPDDLADALETNGDGWALDLLDVRGCPLPW